MHFCAFAWVSLCFLCFLLCVKCFSKKIKKVWNCPNEISSKWQNGYPIRDLDKITNKFLDKSFKKQMITTVSWKTLGWVLSNTGTQLSRLKTKINEMFKGQLTSGNLEIIFRSTQGISYCRFTDTILIIPCALLSSVIYEYKCTRCSFRYIGLTYRYWEKRLKEHLHMLALTGKPL